MGKGTGKTPTAKTLHPALNIQKKKPSQVWVNRWKCENRGEGVTNIPRHSLGQRHIPTKKGNVESYRGSKGDEWDKGKGTSSHFKFMEIVSRLEKAGHGTSRFQQKKNKGLRGYNWKPKAIHTPEKRWLQKYFESRGGEKRQENLRPIRIRFAERRRHPSRRSARPSETKQKRRGVPKGARTFAQVSSPFR